MRVRISIMLLLAALLQQSACSTKPSAESQSVSAKPGESSAEVAVATIPADPGDIKIQLVDAEQFSNEMAARQGKVVLLDMWATW